MALTWWQSLQGLASLHLLSSNDFNHCLLYSCHHWLIQTSWRWLGFCSMTLRLAINSILVCHVNGFGWCFDFRAWPLDWLALSWGSSSCWRRNVIINDAGSSFISLLWSWTNCKWRQYRLSVYQSTLLSKQHQQYCMLVFDFTNKPHQQLLSNSVLCLNIVNAIYHYIDQYRFRTSKN